MGLAGAMSFWPLERRREWISALDTIESLHPRAVIAGHKRPGKDDSPKIIEETRQYIRESIHEYQYPRVRQPRVFLRNLPSQSCGICAKTCSTYTRRKTNLLVCWGLAWLEMTITLERAH